MNIYKLSQTVNTRYESYDSMIVSAENEDKARFVKPDYADEISWAPPECIKVEYIGEYHKNVSEVILASFNAG